MKIKNLILTAIILAITTSISFAQKQKATTTAPDTVVKNLYAAQKNEKTNPFDQASRVLVDKYFTKDFADLIWKTIKTEDGWRHIDALYDSHEQLRDSQDPQITNFVVGAPKEDGSPDDVYVKVTFKNHGEAGSSGFKLRREANKTWKIAGIDYSDGDDLASILRFATDAEYRKEYDADTFQGNYMVGATPCRIERTMSSYEFYRVTCDGQEGFKIYAVDGNVNETYYVHTDDKGKETGKFVIKGGEKDGKFFDAAGKEVKVKRVEPSNDAKTSIVTTPEVSENETISGELEIGKTRSVILYVGMETGDYAAYCFKNDSEAGRAILAKCKNKEKCEVTATLGGDEKCTVPGLEATLSADFNIIKVASVKSLGRQK